MGFSSSDFFRYRLEYVETGLDGLLLMEGWLQLETAWRGELLRVLCSDARSRLRSEDSREQTLAIQVLAFAGEREDLETLASASIGEGSVLEDRELAIATLRRELTSYEELAGEVHDGLSFERFVQEVIRRRARIDHLLEEGHTAAEISPRERWAVHSISLFLDNARLLDENLLASNGPSWAELAQAILRGRDFE